MDLQLLDVVEASASGLGLRDAVEVEVLRGALELRLEDGAMPQEKVDLWSKVRGAEVVGTHIKATKSIYGNTFAPSGLVAVARACQTIMYGLNTPDLHLRQAADMNAGGEGCEQGGAEDVCWRFATEVWEASSHTQLVGVSSFSIDGTNVHCILQGNRGADVLKRSDFSSSIRKMQRSTGVEKPGSWLKRESRPLSWWPGAPAPRRKPLVGYFIRGTWDAWKYGTRMQEEGDGVYGHTVILGQNNWEQFQIWEDDDYMKVLHPSDEVKGGIQAEADTLGPDRDMTPYPDELDEGALLHVKSCWRISGDPEYVQLINELQERQLQEREAAGDVCPFRSHPTVLAFAGSGAPKGYDGNGEIENMPLVRTNLPRDDAKPDDRYRVRLHVRGQKKMVEWVKLDESDGALFFQEDDNANEAFEHRYFIVGDHTFWKPVPMQCANAEEGLHVVQATLLKAVCNFQIYRDADYDQGFFPRVLTKDEGGTTNSEIAGPMRGSVTRRSWRISGQIGDVFRIEFRRHPNWTPSGTGGQAEAERRRLSVSWECAGRAAEGVDTGRLASQHKYFLKWKGTEETAEMKKDESGNFYLVWYFESVERESFQILLDDQHMSTVYPRFNDASCADEDRSRADPQGPDDGGAGKYWTMGAHPNDLVLKTRLAPVKIILEMQDGWPLRVRWESTYDTMSHQKRMAIGCRDILERHARLQKLALWESDYQPARETGRPEWAGWAPSRPGDVVGVLRPPPGA